MSLGDGLGVSVGLADDVVGLGFGLDVVGDGVALCVGLGDVVGIGRPGKGSTSCPRSAAAV